MSVVRAIILDFDGVLAESNAEKTKAFEELFALYPEHSEAMLAYHMANHSSPRMRKFEYYVHELMAQRDNDELVQVMAGQFSAFAVRRVTACPDVPGARAFLEEFRSKVPLYVSSVTPQDELRRIVRARRLTHYFADVFGDPPYCKPDAIGAVLARESLLPSDVLFVGDSASDYRYATEAGLQFIGRDSGQPFEGIAIELHKDMNEIAGIVRRWLGNGGT